MRNEMTRTFRQSPLMLLTLLLLFMGMGQGMNHAACLNALCLPSESESLCDETPGAEEGGCPAAEPHRHHQTYAPVLRCKQSGISLPQPLPAGDVPVPELRVRYDVSPAFKTVGLPRAPEPLLRSWRPLLL